MKTSLKAFGGLSRLKRTYYSIYGTFKLRLRPIMLTDEDLLFLLDGNFKDIDNFIHHIRERQFPKFFIDVTQKEEIISLINRYFPTTVKETIKQADLYCNHIFDLLGSGPKFVGYSENSKKINWHIDFKVNRKWPLRHYKSYDTMELGKPSDIKVPWELSRFQHLAVLGKAYWFTGNEKYAEEFVNQINDWIDQNPVGLGVNWICAMEVAIRAINWILGYHFFRNSPKLTDVFLKRFLKSLFLHGQYIMENLEYGEITTNHYLSDIVGLLYLGVMFPEFKSSETWREFAVKELISEIEKQVFDDGVDFENSTGYHRLVLELFFAAAFLCKINGIGLPQKFWDKLEKMFDYVLYYLKPNGRAPIIGDNDNGRLFVFKERDINDHSYLLTLGALMFNKSAYKLNTVSLAEEGLWYFGPAAIEKYSRLKLQRKTIQSKAFKQAGVYILRNKRIYIFVTSFNCRAGVNKQIHAHNDDLSFELNVDGQDVIVDPGSYVYTSNFALRNLFRSTKFHNTVMIDRTEIKKFAGFWSLSCNSKPRLLNWISSKEEDILEVEHYGYSWLKQPVTHRRKFRLGKNQNILEIVDIFEGVGQHIFEFYFHFSPGVRVTYTGSDQLHITIHSKSIVLKYHDYFDDLSIENGYYSPSYGIKIKAPYIKFTKYGITPFKTSFKIIIADTMTKAECRK